MTYKLTVIIPTYNAENYILEAVNSIKEQSLGFENIELILVDDNSNDNTKNILKDLSSDFDNVKTIFLESNSGSASEPRNDGIQHSSSDYIMFLDSDDSYSPQMCEKMYDAITKNDSDIVCCRFYKLKDDVKSVPYFFLDDFNFNNYSNFKGQYDEKDQILYLKNIDDFPEIMSLGNPSMVWNKIFRKSVILERNIKFPKGNYYEDIYFSMKFLLHAKNIVFLNDFFGYNYVIRRGSDSSVSQNFSQSMLIKQLNGFKNIMDLFDEENYHNDRLKSELIVDMTKIYMFADIEKDCQNKFLNIMKPYYKDYKIGTKVNTASFAFNFVINIFIKIFGLNKGLAIFIKNLFLKIKNR